MASSTLLRATSQDAWRVARYCVRPARMHGEQHAIACDQPGTLVNQHQ